MIFERESSDMPKDGAYFVEPLHTIAVAAAQDAPQCEGPSLTFVQKVVEGIEYLGPGGWFILKGGIVFDCAAIDAGANSKGVALSLGARRATCRVSRSSGETDESIFLITWRIYNRDLQTTPQD